MLCYAMQAAGLRRCEKAIEGSSDEDEGSDDE
jgi:hypothetical protein